MAQTWAFGTSATKDQSAGAASIVVNKPTSTADGELLVAYVTADDFAAITAPSGWTQFTGSPQSVSANLKGAAYYKVASGEGASWTWTTAGAKLYEGYVARYTGLTSTPHDISNGAAGSTGAATVTAPAVTTTAADDLVVRVAGTWNATSVSFASGSSRINAGSNGDLMILYDQDQAAAGSTGTNVATANTTNAMVAFTGAFLQSGGGGGSTAARRLPVLGVG